MSAEENLPPLVVTPPPGPKSRAIAARLSKLESPSFDERRAARAEKSGEDHTPIVYASARGSNVICADGNRYVDLVMGFGACIFGHAPVWLSREVARVQSELPLALGDVYASEHKAVLLEKVVALFPEAGARVLLGITGADAVTAAMKTAVLATGKSGVVAFEGAYHGLSYAPLAACGLAPGFRAPFEAQLGSHVRFAPYPDSRADDPARSLADALLHADRLAGRVQCRCDSRRARIGAWRMHRAATRVLAPAFARSVIAAARCSWRMKYGREWGAAVRSSRRSAKQRPTSCASARGSEVGCPSRRASVANPRLRRGVVMAGR